MKVHIIFRQFIYSLDQFNMRPCYRKKKKIFEWCILEFIKKRARGRYRYFIRGRAFNSTTHIHLFALWEISRVWCLHPFYFFLPGLIHFFLLFLSFLFLFFSLSKQGMFNGVAHSSALYKFARGRNPQLAVPPNWLEWNSYLHFSFPVTAAPTPETYLRTTRTERALWWISDAFLIFRTPRWYREKNDFFFLFFHSICFFIKSISSY